MPKCSLYAGIALALVAAGVAGAETEARTLISPAPAAGAISLSVSNEVQAAVDRGLEWLAARQREDGSWSNGMFPALTALPLQALSNSRDPRRQPAADKAVKYILSCVQPDGGIYKTVPGRKGGGLSNYNTAISMTALHATRRRDLLPVIRAARTFVAGSQHFGDDVYKGGFGYDRNTERAYADLLNTYYAAVAMRETQDVEDTRPAGRKKADIDWAETVKFIEKMQNPPGDGTAGAGGMFYKPGESKAGTVTNEAGTVMFRSYGSITYAGLLALVYANVDRDDVRVRSAFDWASKNWTLEENPGMGAEGLYFFYNVLSKSLDVYGQELVPRPGNTFVNWRDEVARKIVSIQKIDPDTGHGYWVNESGRFWESDSVLVTAYAVLALQSL